MSGTSLLLDAFKERNFARYVAGNSISLVGNWVQRTTIAWITWDLTGSTTWLGLIAFADLFPAILIGPFGGVLADRVSRRNIIIIVQFVMLILSLTLAALAWNDVLDRWNLLGIVLVHGILVGLNQPARLAFVSALIQPAMLPTAVAINSIVFNTARFIGPAIAGLLLATVGVGWTFFANSLTYIPLLLALGLLALPARSTSNSKRKPMMQEIAQGVRYLFDDRQLRSMLALFLACSILVRPISELLPAVADGTFERGAIGLAWMSGALGIGAMIGGYTLATHPDLVAVKRYRFWLLASAIMASMFILSPIFAFAVLGIGLCGFCFVVAGVGANTIIQVQAPDELRGRVLSLYGIIARAMPAFGALGLGLAADQLGLIMAVLLSSILFVSIFIIMEVRH